MDVQQQGLSDVFPTRPFSKHDLEPLLMDQEPPDFAAFWNHSFPRFFEDSDSTASVSHLEEMGTTGPSLRKKFMLPVCVTSENVSWTFFFNKKLPIFYGNKRLPSDSDKLDIRLHGA